VMSDDLAKLWELKQAGALTEDEFNSAKARLLAAVPANLEQTPAVAAAAIPVSYSVLIVDPGRTKMKLLQALRIVRPDLTLAAVAETLKLTPSPIASGLPHAEANRVLQMLQGAGARAEVRVDA
jgi:ribosomal protein L7/L12